MSLDTSTTSRPACCSRSACTTPRIWLSALPCGRPAGSLHVQQVVWKNSLPPASRWPVLASGMPLDGVARVGGLGGQRVEFAADLARVARHLAHALLVAVEFFQRDHRQEDVVLLEAEQDIGSCISTLVSSTNSLAGPSVPRGVRAGAPAAQLARQWFSAAPAAAARGAITPAAAGNALVSNSVGHARCRLGSERRLGAISCRYAARPGRSKSVGEECGFGGRRLRQWHGQWRRGAANKKAAQGLCGLRASGVATRRSRLSCMS
jgi:hypothetical protein